MYPFVNSTSLKGYNFFIVRPTVYLNLHGGTRSEHSTSYDCNDDLLNRTELIPMVGDKTPSYCK